MQFKEYDFSTTSLPAGERRDGDGEECLRGLAGRAHLKLCANDQLCSTARASVCRRAARRSGRRRASVLAQNALGIYSNSSLFALSTAGRSRRQRVRVGRGLWRIPADEFRRAPALARTARQHRRAHGAHRPIFPGLCIDAAADHGRAADYNNVLPALNLVWSLRDDFLTRLGVFARPVAAESDGLAASTAVTVSGTQFNVKTGNPNILPFLANAYDLSFEWYPATGTMLSVAPFCKQVLTFHIHAGRPTRSSTAIRSACRIRWPLRLAVRRRDAVRMRPGLSRRR